MFGNFCVYSICWMLFSFLTLKQRKKDVAPEQFSVGATRSEVLADPCWRNCYSDVSVWMRSMSVPAGNLLTRVALTFALLHIRLNALIVHSVWSQGLAVCASPSATDVSLMITLFCRSFLSLSACKICINSSMEKLYINYKFLRTGIVLLTTVQ